MFRPHTLFVVASLVLSAIPAAALKVRPRVGQLLHPAVYGLVVGSGVRKPAAITVDVVANPDSRAFTVTVGWYNTSAASSATLYRSIGGGVYVPVNAANGSFLAKSNSTIIDSTPPIDGQACYKIAVTNNGESASSDAACVLTPDGRDRPLWRATLRVGVANVSDAGTNSAVHVRLNSPTGIGFSPSGNETWIDTPRDDFEAGTTRNYELLLSRVGTSVGDVKMIVLRVAGGDAVCIRSVELFLNGISMFTQDFGNAGRWVAEDNPLIVTREQLRASTTWQTTPAVERPAITPYEFVDSLATAAVGNALHGRDLNFRDTSPNPQTTTTSGSRRVYEWDIADEHLPIKLQAELLTDTTCKGGTMRGRIFVGAVDADAASWFYLTIIGEAIVEIFEPTFPSLASPIEVDLGPCSFNMHLCFMNNGLGAHFGTCGANP